MVVAYEKPPWPLLLFLKCYLDDMNDKYNLHPSRIEIRKFTNLHPSIETT